MKVKVVSIVGPTAVGKTDLSIQIAKKFNAEIISGDSMQVYRRLNIGTAKITEDEKEGIPHYMIDLLEPDQPFTVAQFKEKVQHYIEKINRNNKLPLIVGGSGLYIQSVLYDYQFERSNDEDYRKKLESIVEKEGIERLYNKLIEIDPIQAGKIHPNNHRRVIRALEIFHTTGKRMSELIQSQKREPLYDMKIIGLDMDRQLLYQRINDRVDLMMEEGLLDEVKALYDDGLKNSQSMTGIGYKEFIPFFEGEIDLETAIETLKRNTRRFAKRQFTFFRNRLPVDWYEITENNRKEQYERIIENLAGFLNRS